MYLGQTDEENGKNYEEQVADIYIGDQQEIDTG